MICRDKQSYNCYDGFYITEKSIVKLELEQKMEFSVGDIMIAIPELKAFLFISAKDYDERFLTIKDER